MSKNCVVDSPAAFKTEVEEHIATGISLNGDRLHALLSLLLSEVIVLRNEVAKLREQVAA